MNLVMVGVRYYVPMINRQEKWEHLSPTRRSQFQCGCQQQLINPPDRSAPRHPPPPKSHHKSGGGDVMQIQPAVVD